MPIPGLSHASPIVWGSRVYAITAIADAPSDLDMKAEGVVFAKDTVRHTWRLIAFDRATGREVWNRVAHQGTPAQPRHVRGTYTNATPATDGRTIVAVLGNEGLFAFDMNGTSKWRVPMAPATASWSLDPASSPIVFGDLAIVQSDFQQQGFLAAYDLETGRERWRVARDEGLTWSTPTIWKPGDGPPQLVVNSGRWIRSYEPATGREIWRLNNEAKGSWDRVATPIAAGNLMIVAGGGGERPIVAVRSSAKGDLQLGPGEGVSWVIERGSPYLSTPLAYRGLLYVCASNGVLTVYRIETGALVYRTRLTDTPLTISASPIVAGDRLYFVGDDGDVDRGARGRDVRARGREPDGRAVLRNAGDRRRHAVRPNRAPLVRYRRPFVKRDYGAILPRYTVSATSTAQSSVPARTSSARRRSGAVAITAPAR